MTRQKWRLLFAVAWGLPLALVLIGYAAGLAGYHYQPTLFGYSLTEFVLIVGLLLVGWVYIAYWRAT